MKSGFPAFLKLIRWPNLIVIILTQYLLRYAIIGRIYGDAGFSPAMDNVLFALLVISTVLIAAAGYIINDYYDLRTDVINRPGSLILGRKIQSKSGILFYVTMNALALIAGIVLSWKAGSLKLVFIFLMIIILLWLYSVRYKKTVLWGNLAVSFMSAMVVLVVWLFEFYMLRGQPEQFIALYGEMKLISRYIFVYALFAFLITLIREIVKDIEDVNGDQKTGCKTLPVVYGIHTAKFISYIPGFLTIALTIASAFYLNKAGMVLPAIYFAAAVLLPLLFILYQIFQASERADYHLISNLLKILMLAGVIGLQPLAMSI